MADPKVAVLIDYENVYWSLKRQYGHPVEPGRLMEALREIAGRHGTVCLMLAYADFDNPEFHGLLSALQRRSVEPRHVFSKNYEDGTRKNAADIEMSLEALELMYERQDIGVFVLVSGDRDMIQVIRKLRSRGKQVHVIGVERAMSKDLVSFANGFATVEHLLGIQPPAAAHPVAAPGAAPAPSPAAPPGAPVAPAAPAAPDPSPLLATEAMLRRLHDMEQAMPFVGLKYFMKVLSGSDSPDSRVYELVNRAISDGLIQTYPVPNPHDERFPTTACRINRDNPAARQAVGLPPAPPAATSPNPPGATSPPSPAAEAPPAAAPSLLHSIPVSQGAVAQAGELSG